MQMRADETRHRQRLLYLYQKQFGNHIPLIRRQDVRGFVHRMPVWLVRPLGLDVMRKQASAIEVETRRFYERAASRAKVAMDRTRPSSTLRRARRRSRALSA